MDLKRLKISGPDWNNVCQYTGRSSRNPRLPEYLGKLNFYLEALDRNVRAHEQPAIGVLLCASKNNEVVEYALSRSLSTALIAEYRTRLPDKKLLQAKLHEFYLQNAPDQP
ncbi:PDDEXK nuclease domain-containing protein [Edaphobacter aggregans]|uniref:PDDEXK nuclease domain-containing protein n=1 Tax=Edaphobacter aggregans TaxID=570835 RepID=UPI0005580930|nr:PDDEXK nuclease domain-containing protein [Edaphobacter aggregans]